VAALEATQRRCAVRAISLAAVLIVCKAITLVLVRGSGPWPDASPWMLIAYVWQDVLLALVFFLFDSWIKRPALAWTAYTAIVVYSAVNVPIAGTLSSPLTWTLMRAAGGALSDSIRHYATLPNLLALILPLLVGFGLPVWLERRQATVRLPWLIAALAVVVVGPFAASRVDTKGLHRNAVSTLVETSLPRLPAIAAAEDWRESPFDAEAGEDLRHLRGALHGRNVVFVALESTAASYLGLYGAARDPMPALSALARDGLVFDRAYAAYPESIKGLYTTLCSAYTAFDTAVETYADVPCDSVANRLHAAGYRTALYHSGRFDYLGMKGVIERRGFDALEDAGSIGGNVHSSFGVDERSTVTRLLGWIDDGPRDRPFFVTYLPIAGHHPYVSTIPGPFDGSDDRTLYLNALHEADAALEQLIEGLRARGLDRDTLFVIAGDHGEAFGQHPGNYAHTLFIYEENVRVPLIIAAPGSTLDGARVRRLASAIDLAPTILSLVGLPIPADYEGVSLLEPGKRMALFYTDYSLGWLGLADGCWKYLFEIDSARSHLFDVCADSGETDDRAGANGARVAFYRARVEAWAAAQKASVAARARRRALSTTSRMTSITTDG
jgi:arylsulfatase A-like enzyme